jgi:hypothetical protein
VVDEARQAGVYACARHLRLHGLQRLGREIGRAAAASKVDDRTIRLTAPAG